MSSLPSASATLWQSYSLEVWLDPARLEEGYVRMGFGEGPVVGHEFGLDLSLDERTDLIAFLRTL